MFYNAGALGVNNKSNLVVKMSVPFAPTQRSGKLRQNLLVPNSLTLFSSFLLGQIINGEM
jgi:hypothetical protein